MHLKCTSRSNRKAALWSRDTSRNSRRHSDNFREGLGSDSRRSRRGCRTSALLPMAEPDGMAASCQEGASAAEAQQQPRPAAVACGKCKSRPAQVQSLYRSAVLKFQPSTPGTLLRCCCFQALARQREQLCGECICEHVRSRVRSTARVDGLIQRGDTVVAAVSGGKQGFCRLLSMICMPVAHKRLDTMEPVHTLDASCMAWLEAQTQYDWQQIGSPPPAPLCQPMLLTW